MMSAKAKAIKTLYRVKRITAEGVKEAVEKGIITQAECDEILSLKQV